MKHLKQLKALEILLFIAFCPLLFCSCSTFYFDRPVPQKADEMTAVPPEWVGLYACEVEPDSGMQEGISPLENLFRPFVRISRWTDTYMSVTFDRRLGENDWSTLNDTLAAMKTGGMLLDYQLNPKFILLHLPGGAEHPEETQFIPLIREGIWYVLGENDLNEMMYLVDFDAKTISTLQRQHKRLSREIFSNADSLRIKISPLVARKKSGHYYLNEMAAAGDFEPARYFLYHLYQPLPNEMIVQYSEFDMPDDTLHRHLSRLNRITPFRPIGDGNYSIDPDDKALEKLLTYPGLFQEIHLLRMPE